MIIILKPRGLFFIKLMKTAVLFLILLFDFCSYNFMVVSDFKSALLTTLSMIFRKKNDTIEFDTNCVPFDIFFFFLKIPFPIYIFQDFQKENF